jgi:hypothetical protein
MSRADVDVYEANKLPPCYFYVDEFQNFANESFASILSEARKYKLALTVAHQYIEQMTDDVKSAVFGNVGTMITFRIGATDAEVFEKEFAPKFVLDDFVNLSAFQIYLRLMIDGQGSAPFSAKTLPRMEKPTHSHEQAVIAFSRSTYAKQKFIVEDEILEFYKPAPKVEKLKPENLTPEMKFLKVSEYRGNDQGQAQKQNDAFKRFDAPKKYNETRRQETSPITRYDTPTSFTKKPENTYVTKSDTSKPEPAFEEKKIFENTKQVVEKQLDAIVVPQTIQQSSQTNQSQVPRRHSIHNNPAERRPQQEQPLIQKFDDKPAMSLKEALAKALSEQSQVSTPHIEEPKKEIPQDIKVSHYTKREEKEEKQKPREISEDVLRKLLEE